MNEYRNIDKIKPEELLRLAREVLDKSTSFEFISGIQPFLMSFEKEQFYVYIKNISSAYFSDRDKTTRAQLPIKPEFKTIKESNIPFIFFGYDGINDVLVSWNFHIAKERLNVGKSVSFYSRIFYQSEVKDGEFLRRKLKNGDLPVFFKRSNLVEFFKNINSFFSTNDETSNLFNVRFLNDTLEWNFCNYMRINKKLSEKSIKNYSNALKGRISLGLKKYFLPEIDTIFYVNDIKILADLKSKLFATVEYDELNLIGKNMYSCALDNYIEFLSSNKEIVNNKPLQSLNVSSKSLNKEDKLLKIEDKELLSKLQPYILSNKLLSAAQLVGDHYKDQFPSMQLKDWINLVKNIR